MRFQLLLNEPGSGEATVPKNTSGYDSVVSGDIVRISYRGGRRFAFFAETIDHKRIVSDDYSGMAKVVRGRGAMAILDEGFVWYTVQGEATREFTGQSIMKTFVDLFDDAQARGCFPDLELEFTATEDTDGNSWTDTTPIKLDVKMSLLSLLRKISKLGIDFKMDFDWQRDKYFLEAYRDGAGSDVSDNVIFREGKNCIEVTTSESTVELKNTCLVEYDGGRSFEVVSDASSQSSYRRRETALSANQCGSQAVAQDYGQAEVDGKKNPDTSIAIKITDQTGSRVFEDYGLGDTVGYAKYDEEGPTDYRILGMTLDFSEDQEYADVTLILNSVRKPLEIRNAEAIRAMGGNLDSGNAQPSNIATSISEHNQSPNPHPNKNFISHDESPEADDIPVFNNGSAVKGRSFTELLQDLSGQATQDFSINGQKITDLATPTANDDAATKQYVDNNVGSASGGIVATGSPQANDYARFVDGGTAEGRSFSEVLEDLSGQAGTAFDWNTQRLVNVVDPVNDQDAATKKYVDDNISPGGTEYLRNWALGASYTITPSPSGPYPDHTLKYIGEGDADWQDRGLLTSDDTGEWENINVGYVGVYNNTATIALDLGSSRVIEIIRIWGLYGDAGVVEPSAIKVEYSDNGSTYTTLEDRTGMSNSGDINKRWKWMAEFDGESEDHRYWKITVTRGSGGSWIFMSEVQIFGKHT